jgi:hypothetical protein
MFRTYIEQLQKHLGDANKAMIEENAGNPIANQK